MIFILFEFYFFVSEKVRNFACHYKNSAYQAHNFLNYLITNKEMKADIHPANYREVVFKDMSNDETFIVRSTVATKETIELNGQTYPLVKL